MAVPDEAERKLTRTVRRQATDPSTGQVLDLHWEEPLKRRAGDKPKSAEPFGLFFPEGFRRLATMDLRGEDYRLFIYLVGIMGFDTPFDVNVTEIAKELGTARPNCSRALQRLRRIGLVIDFPDRRILLDPYIVWRGSVLGRNEMLARLNAPKKARPST